MSDRIMPTARPSDNGINIMTPQAARSLEYLYK